MTPILYRGDETSFTSEGLGRLSDCLRCVVTEERNGIFECEFDYPVSGALFENVREGNIIAVTHDGNGDIQPFDIYGRTAPINGIVTFYAHHISYRLGHIILKPTNASSCAAALAKLETDTYNRNPFTFWTDKNVSAAWTNDRPQAVKAVLGGQAGSILDVYGKGEYKFDKFAVKLYTNRGADNNVTIRYGVNMTDIRQDIDLSGRYAAVAPFWAGEDGVVTLPEGYITGNVVPVSLYSITNEDDVEITDASGNPLECAAAQIDPVPLDLTAEFENMPTVAELRALALKRINTAQPWLANETVEVDFVELSQTTDYAGYANLATVELCDTVTIYDEILGVGGVKSKVVKFVWNPLNDSPVSVALGTAQTNFTDVVAAQIDAARERLATIDYMQTAVKDATDQITGALGGYVVFTRDADGNPTEICIMDAPTIAEAVNVWRWNKNGLGHSHNGYNGPYDDVALTQDGKINASMITAGTLNANLIRAGVIQDQTGTSYWNLVTGVLNVVGQFAAETSTATGVYRMELVDGGLALYRDNAKIAALEWHGNFIGNSISLRAVSAALDALADDEESGAAVTVTRDGVIHLTGDIISVGGANEVELSGATGTISFIDDGGYSHTIAVKNGIVTSIS